MVRILHDDWSIRLGENRPDQRSQTFNGYGCHNHAMVISSILRHLCIESLRKVLRLIFIPFKCAVLSFIRAKIFK